MDFTGKVAIVTGGGSGIGQASAILYASLGTKVVVADLNETGGQQTVAAIKNRGGDAIFVKTDVSNPANCESMVAAAISQYGKLDIAFNNAGIGGESNAVADMSIGGWNHIIAVNLNSVFYCMKYELAEMLKNGKGAIVNMSSILGKVAFANSAGYVAAKHGVIGLTENAAVEYASKGIRINSVGPGFINTPLLTSAGIDDAVKKQLCLLHPIGRLGESGEVAELVVWLTSDNASFITGAYYPVDGGYLAV